VSVCIAERCVLREVVMANGKDSLNLYMLDASGFSQDINQRDAMPE
jgi:hypothetical protein